MYTLIIAFIIFFAVCRVSIYNQPSFPHATAYHISIARAEQMFEHLSEHLFEHRHHLALSLAVTGEAPIHPLHGIGGGTPKPPKKFR